MCLSCAIQTVMDLDSDLNWNSQIPDDWRERIEWPEITKEMAEGVLLIRRLYNESTGLGQFTGQPLHVYLDDYNCDDETMKFYVGRIDNEWVSERDGQNPEEVLEVGKRILRLSLPLTEKQRITMVSCAHSNIPELPR